MRLKRNLYLIAVFAFGKYGYIYDSLVYTLQYMRARQFSNISWLKCRLIPLYVCA